MAEMWKPQSLDVYHQWIQDIVLQSSDNLNDWENSFIANMNMRIDKGMELTQPMAEKLEQIYLKHTK